MAFILKSMREQELEMPRGRLRELRENTAHYMVAGGCRHVSDDWIGKLHELVDRAERKADKSHGETGIYPDAFVLRFLKRISWATERSLTSNARTTS